MKQTIFVVALLAGLSVASADRTLAQDAWQPERFSAWALSMSTIAPGTNMTVEFWVDRWSTPEERETLITTMVEKGSDALLRVIERMPAHGRMRVPGWRGPDPHNARLGWDIKYAWQEPLAGGGRRIMLAFDRYIGFEEARSQARTMDYPFTLVEVRLDAEGKGEGRWSVATKITFDKNRKQLELENYSSEPVRLQKVRAEAK